MSVRLDRPLTPPPSPRGSQSLQQTSQPVRSQSLDQASELQAPPRRSSRELGRAPQIGNQQHQNNMEQLFGEATAGKLKGWIQRAKGRVIVNNAKQLPTPSGLRQQMETARMLTAPSLETAKELNTISGALQASQISGNTDAISQFSHAFGTGHQLSALGTMGTLGALATAAGVVDLAVSWKEQGVFSERINGLKELTNQLDSLLVTPVQASQLDKLGINSQAVERALGKTFAEGINSEELAKVLPVKMLESSTQVLELLKNEKAGALKNLTNNKHVTTALTGIKAGADMTVFVAKIAAKTAVASTAGIVAGVTLAAIGTYGMVSDSVAGIKARSKENKATAFLQSMQGKAKTQATDDLEQSAQKVKANNRKTWKTKLVSFMKNACMATAGVLVTVAAVSAGALALATPVGWAALAVGAIGFGIAIGLAAKGVKDARASKEQASSNQINRNTLQAARTQLSNAQTELAGLSESIRKKSNLVEHAPPDRTAHLQQELQQLTTRRDALNLEVILQQGIISDMDKALMGGDSKYRAEKVLSHLKGQGQAKLEATAFAKSVLGFNDQQIQSLLSSSEGPAIELLASRMA